MMSTQTLLILIICLLALCLVAVILLVVVLMFKFFKNDITSRTQSPTLPTSTKTGNIQDEKVVESFHCKTHKDQESVGTCLICEDSFCENCLRDDESKHFCTEHFKTYVSNKWTILEEIKTTPDTPYEALNLYHFKRHKWLKDKAPSFIITHYKIDTENDLIESYVQLNVIEDFENNLKEEFKNYKGQD